MVLGTHFMSQDGLFHVSHRFSRFNRVAWSAPVTQQRRGVIATGSDNGEVTLWNPAGIEASDSYVIPSIPDHIS